jgi:hypothetical protein
MYTTTAERRRIDNWRYEVADSAAPVVIRSNDRSFRNGIPAPVQVHVDDGLGFKSTETPSLSYTPTTMSRRPREITRRPSSHHGGYPRRSSLRTSSRPAADRYSKSKYDDYDRRYDRRDSLSKQGASIWSSLLPSSRNSRSRTMTYDKPVRRTLSPEYVHRREEPEVTVYSSRPKSSYAPVRTARKEFVVARSGTTKGRTRKDSFGVGDRMRLLDIGDRFREEVEKARQWQSPRPNRQHDYDRRSSYY